MLARGQDGLGLKLGMHLYRLLGWLFIRLPSIFGSEAPSFKIKSVSRISVFSRVTGICTAQIRLRSFYPEQQGLSHAPTSPLRMRATFLYYALPCLPVAWSSITVYYQQPFGATKSTTTTGASSAAAASYTGAAAYDPTILTPPPVPDPAPPTTFFQQLSSTPVPGLSIPQSGYFFGFSVEFSVITQVCEWTLHTCILNIH